MGLCSRKSVRYGGKQKHLCACTPPLETRSAKISEVSDPPCPESAVVAGQRRAAPAVDRPQAVSVERPPRPRHRRLLSMVERSRVGRAKEGAFLLGPIFLPLSVRRTTFAAGGSTKCMRMPSKSLRGPAATTQALAWGCSGTLRTSRPKACSCFSHRCAATRYTRSVSLIRVFCCC